MEIAFGTFVGTIAIQFLFSFCLPRASKMREANRKVSEYLHYAVGIIPVAAVLIWWVVMSQQSASFQKPVLAIVGAVVGALLLVATGEWIHPSGASPQQSAAANGSPAPIRTAEPDELKISQSSGAQPPAVNLGPGSAYSFGQQGGITAGTLNIGPAKRTLSDPRTESLKKQMLAELPKDKPITIVALLGDTESISFAQEIHSFLKQNGFSMKEPKGISQAVFTPLPKGLIRENTGGEIKLVIGAQ